MRARASGLATRIGPLLLAAGAAAIVNARAFGAGYSLYEQGAAALGMAGAVTASVHDASALFFNPAALAQLPGTQLMLGATALSPVTSFAGTNPYPGYGVTEEMKRESFFTPTLYLTRRLADRWAVGAGLDSPFGLGVDWKRPDQFTGRYVITKADLRVLNGTLSAACAVDSRWGVALGGDVLFAEAELHNRELAPAPGGGGGQVDVAKVDLTTDYKPGYGWHVAVRFAPAAAWRVGAFYRSRVIVDADGDATFTQIPTGDPVFDAAVADSLPPGQGVSTTLRFPAIWSAGLAWMPTAAWTAEVTADFTEWSVFSDLPLRFDRTPSIDRTIVENYDDSWQVRVGAEHRLPAFTYRFGYYFDQAAAPTESVTPLLPDANRHGVTLGLGLGFGPEKRWTLDVYELALFVERRSTEMRERDGFDGEYKTYVNAAGMSLGHRW